MITNQTIDGVPRELIEKAMLACFEAGFGIPHAELRALLDSEPCAKSQAEPDPMLCNFYEVTDWPGLVRELVGHVAQLQDSAKRNVKPWEDTFPPTLLPAYIERVDSANAAAQPQGEPVERIQYDDDDAQAAFEVLNPMPRHVTKFKGGYAATEFNAWDAHEFCKKWDGFKQCANLYAEQPVPVADPLAKGFTTLESDCGKYKIVTSFATRDDAWSAYRALVGAKAAPVAVVVPTADATGQARDV